MGSAIILFGASGCSQAAQDEAGEGPVFLSEPLVSEIYTADPSTHVWEDGRIYIYASHDIESGIPEDDLGSHFAMRDYHVLSMDRVGGPVTVHPVALDIDDVPWAGRQMWAPDAAYKDGTYFLYFPAKDKQDVFRIGVATSTTPVGPFTAQPEAIAGSYSMDPNVFRDSDGTHYMYFGGIWGGQLQRWANGQYDANGSVSDLEQPDQPAIMPRIARMSGNMLEFAEEPREVMLLDELGQPLLGGDNDRRFFEGAWVFKRGETYYLTYSTGDTHYVVYATGTSPYGPFTYRGRILNPVQGWTSHHSVTEIAGQWYLSYHDTQLSGQTHLRNVMMAPLTFNADGTIQTITPMR
ncbi:glycoside hydrolase family 43 protein [Altererythrobacter sp. KTW20L]|uniref:glycoside hydrolase family 43 protein n=1 Tax=Altererythrobacter sp. KTW20L TaxID=2942210 RepID=UPI0020BF5EAB|nr:glycoside hydrolase family 43 protein [Altererythrobacter sp. KTW20L]